MKKNIIFYCLGATLLFITGCTKDDGPVPKEVQLQRVPIPKLVKNGGSVTIDLTNLPGFSGKFDVGLLYPGDTPPSKMDVVIRKNNTTNIKVIQAGITAYPTTLTITAAQIATLFGAPILLNDNYDIGADVYTQDGKKFESFPAIGVGAAASINGTIPGSSPTIRYSAICAYNPDIFQGNFKAADGFGDADGATIAITKIDNTRFSFIYPSAINPVPIVVTVNPIDNNASVVNVPLTIGTRWDPAYGYPNTALYVNPSLNSAVGFVAPCDRKITLNIQWGTNAGALQFGGGPYSLVLTKL